ncbi:Spo0B C-terminal domain-containing protein [Priestia aryabhattai]|uniref:Spo0B C-terminal domain-containing protein n=1 Tax=Priestia aryabhattai TaxID=412384 RepID=UPI001C0BDD56|nr:Spo0B C-terminal domain-containing protein [Priestia aryabhattai]MBU3572300.1 Spo0B domain-containing protein [Priestia aryabhattai]
MEKEWDVVEVLRYARHDWLNKLQLIKGNLALNRLDRANEIIEEIVNESKHESKLTNINMRLFAGFVMTYHWNNHAVRLDVEVLGELKDLSQYDEFVYNWCCYLTEALEKYVDYHAENYLSISVCIEEQGIRFFFDFSGILTDIQKLQNKLQCYECTQGVALVEQHMSEDEFSLMLTIS